MYQNTTLSHADAQAMIAAVQERLESAGKAASIAVTDPHGELIAFLRMDGCSLPPVQIAINKAFTAARERRPSEEMGEASRRGGFPITNYGDLRYTGWAGGYPVVHRGQVVGAIGISGLSTEDEIELTRMAAALPGS